MHFLTALVAILPITASALNLPYRQTRPDHNAFSTIEARQALRKRPTCPAGGVHMMIASGAGAQQIRGYGLLSTAVESVRALMPRSTNFSMQFNKTNDPAAAKEAVAQGVNLTIAHLQWYTAGCPDTPIVLMGYSVGANIIMNALCGRSVNNSLPYGTPLDSSYNHNIVATVLYGDESHVAGQPWDRGTCVNGSGIHPRMNPGSCAAFQDRIESYCELNDPYCCSGSPSPNVTNHYVYPTNYDSIAAKYIQGQYNARKNGTLLP